VAKVKSDAQGSDWRDLLLADAKATFEDIDCSCHEQTDCSRNDHCSRNLALGWLKRYAEKIAKSD
jgi:hypothetical protein